MLFLQQVVWYNFKAMFRVPVNFALYVIACKGTSKSESIGFSERLGLTLLLDDIFNTLFCF